MKTYKILVLLCIMFFVFSSCENNFIEEPLVDLKSGHSGNAELSGFDEWGFNWNAHLFQGYALNMLLGDHYFMNWSHYKKHVYNGEGKEFWNMLVESYTYFPYLIPYELFNAKLVCKWNDALINKDGVYPASWLDSDGWIVFNYSGEAEGKKWSSMRKLVTACSGDELVNGIWYNEDGEEIGLDALFWNDLIVIQVVNHGDVPSYPFFYQDYNSPNGAGYGQYKLNE